MNNTFLEVAIEVAQEAGKILREEMEQPPTISYKGDYDLVTQADRRSEALIVSRLQKYFPEHAVAAEEGTGKNTASEYRWHVDPLDGTTNFAHRYPCFCVSMALARKNELLLGVIYNPIYNELFTAARGEGAFFNGKRMHCSKIGALKNSLLCTGFPNHNREANPNIHFYWDFTLRSHGVRRDGSAALDLACVAIGRFDSFWEFGLNPWDTAAGVILVEEAGGKVTDMQGQPYVLGGPSILASNGLIHEEMLKVVAEVSGHTLSRK
jgi:myo-inositol-1(or 4)-monophosphatase